jgi:hypothetical protein
MPIAATAQVHQETLVTRNVRDFEVGTMSMTAVRSSGMAHVVFQLVRAELKGETP